MDNNIWTFSLDVQVLLEQVVLIWCKEFNLYNVEAFTSVSALHKSKKWANISRRASYTKENIIANRAHTGRGATSSYPIAAIVCWGKAATNGRSLLRNARVLELLLFALYIILDNTYTHTLTHKLNNKHISNLGHEWQQYFVISRALCSPELNLGFIVSINCCAVCVYLSKFVCPRYVAAYTSTTCRLRRYQANVCITFD